MENHSSEKSAAENHSLSSRSLGFLSMELNGGIQRENAELRRRGRFRYNEEPAISPLAWGRAYLPEYFTRPASKLHKWLSYQLDRCQTYRGTKINLLGPRGAAKSTIGTLSYVLQMATEGREPYIWIVSDTRHQAQLHLHNIKLELLDNQRLARDYPQVAGRGPRWTECRVLLRNGVQIEALGTGQSMRGQRFREYRPTLIVCDDLQNDSHISSAPQREKTHQWFHGTLLKAGTRTTNIINLATALHREALAMTLLQSPGWKSKLFRAIQRWPTHMELWEIWGSIYSNVDDPEAGRKARAYFDEHRTEMEAGAELLWPEEEDLYTLMRMRVESGLAAFDREKQCTPINPKDCEFPERYFDDEVIWFDRWPEGLVVRAIALDPSKGKDTRRGDYSAYVLVGIDALGVVYVEADLERRPVPQIVADGVKLCRRFQPNVFGVEANQFQELLADQIGEEFRRQDIGLVPAAIHNQGGKRLRVARLATWLERGKMRFLAGSEPTRLLVEQLREFPLGAHDDGPDALEMALRLAQTALENPKHDDRLGNCLIREP